MIMMTMVIIKIKLMTFLNYNNKYMNTNNNKIQKFESKLKKLF